MTETPSKPAIGRWYVRQSVLALIVSVLSAWAIVSFGDLDTVIYEGLFKWVWPLNPLYIEDLRYLNVSAGYINQITIGFSIFFLLFVILTFHFLNGIARTRGLPELKTASPNSKGAMILMTVLPLLLLVFMYRFGRNNSSRYAPSIHNPPEVFTAFVALFMFYPVFLIVTVLRYMLPSFLVPGRYVERPKDQSSEFVTRKAQPIADPNLDDGW